MTGTRERVQFWALSSKGDRLRWLPSERARPIQPRFASCWLPQVQAGPRDGDPPVPDLDHAVQGPLSVASDEDRRVRLLDGLSPGRPGVPLRGLSRLAAATGPPLVGRHSRKAASGTHGGVDESLAQLV